MQATGRRRRVVAAMTLVFLTVGGCGDGEPATAPATPIPSAAPTPTPSPTVDRTRLPERPVTMAEPTTDGAVAAATWTMELLSYTFASGDTAPWRQLTVESCGLCAGVVQDVTAMVEAGEKSSGYEITVSSPTATEISDDEWFSVEMRVTQGPSHRYDSAGEIIGTGTGGVYDAVVALGWADGWTVHELGLAEADDTGEGDE